MKNCLYLKETNSTNALLWSESRKRHLQDGFTIFTNFQSDGKGQSGNSWESERGKNILASMLLHPVEILIEEQFVISQIISLAIKNVLAKYTDNISIKWPNDIYWKDKKIAGILIENTLHGNKIKDSIIGFGLNVNQLQFISNAPNPISLKQITGHWYIRKFLLKKIRTQFLQLYTELDRVQIRESYLESLYHKDGFHQFRTGGSLFEAEIHDVCSDGRLILKTKDQLLYEFYFKEVSFG